MIRKAIVIGSLGPNSSDRYKKSVDADVNHFVHFIKSPIGGSWEDEEIVQLNKCLSENLIELFQRTHTDYLLVYFSGHGHQDLKETTIAINQKESLTVSQLVSHIKTPKTLIIIDSFRRDVHEQHSSGFDARFLSFNSTKDYPNSRDKYMQFISENSQGIAIAYACSVGEINEASELGGSYTYSLLKTSLEWFERQNNDDVLFINEANNLAHQYLKHTAKFEQNPQVIPLNNREGNLNFPFAIKTKNV